MQAIHIQSFVAAPPGQVWAALFARADLLFDGLPPKVWPEERDEQPPLHLTVAWSHTPEPTEVSLTLHELGGGTRVDLHHALWGEGAGWDAAIQGHFAGWLQGLATLGLMIETGTDARAADPALRGGERYFASGEIPAEAAPVYRSLTDREVLERWSDGVLDGAERVDAIEDRFVRWRLPAAATGGAAGMPGGTAAMPGGAGPAGELVVILRPTPRGTHVALAEYGVADRGASARWPAMFERLARFLG
ncbi:MAG: hypothetical protein A2083_06035 [Gemmatimonadetes bacterium GWC2_71_9]|nr:MAG: hypothetical protein A2083_06035 [Gemmatimonadetes bacterium GWC2_71_9]